MTVAINDKKIIDFLLSQLSYYVKSWRWIPLTKSNINSLISEKRILYNTKNNEFDSMIIFTESEHFEKTIMITLISGSKNGIEKIIRYFQNYAIEKNIMKIQLLTESSIPKINNLDKKFSFCLMKKEL